MGCEHRDRCECLEDLARNENGKPMGFPYSAVGEKKGCLRFMFLETRYAIYECNYKCNCGPTCKNKVVQHGRQIPLEIFKTADRGWGTSTNTSPSQSTIANTLQVSALPSSSAKANSSTHTEAK